MTNAILRGKPDAGNPHVRFDEGEVESAKPRRGSLLYKNSVFMLVLAAVAVVRADESFVSAARWIRSGTAERSFTNSYLRFHVDLPARAVKATLRTFPTSSRLWINGMRSKPLEAVPELARFRGKLRGSGIGDFATFLRPGSNVISIAVSDRDPKYRGLILRGEITCADGRVVEFASNARTVKAAADEQAGWTDPAFDDSAWAPACELGDVRLYPWRLSGSIPAIYCTPREYEAYLRALSSGLPDEELLKEPDNPHARIVYRGDLPGVEINGTVHPPFVMSEVDLPDWPEKTARNEVLAKCRAMGLKFLCVSRYCSDTYVRADGDSWEFSDFDSRIRGVLSAHPDAYIVLYYRNGIGVSDEWAAAHPDELAGYAVTNKSRSYFDYRANPNAPSFASPYYREEQRRYWKAFGEYARTKPWGRRIAGVHCGFGGSGDGMPCGCHALPDTGKRMTEAFRRYLREKYGSDAALQKAWGDAVVTLGTATVPDATARDGSGLFIRDLSDPRDRRIDDYYDCYHREFEDFIIDFGKSVKTALPGCLAGGYYGYAVLGYNPSGMTARFERALASPWIDYLYATVSGNHRMDGLTRHLLSPFHRFGKLSSMEADDRIHTAFFPGQQCNRNGKPLSEFPTRPTPEESRATFSKVVGNSLIWGCGFQMVDFGEKNFKWFNCPEALEPVAAGIREWRRAFESGGTSWRSDVAVVIDPEPIWREGRASTDLNFYYDANLTTIPRQTLSFSGYSYDTLTPEDYVRSTNDYRTAIFLNLFGVSDGLRAALKEKTRRPGVTAVWCVAPGLRTEKGYSDESMSDLTGIRLSASRTPSKFNARFVTGERFDLYSKPRRFDRVGGDAWQQGPRVSSTDPDARILAKYDEDGASVFVRKDLGNGAVSYFTGIPPSDPEVWAKLLAKTGSHAYTKPGFLVRRNSEWLMVYSGKGSHVGWANDMLEGRVDQSGRADVDLGKTCSRVTDVLTGETVATETDRLTLTSETPRTWLLRIE